MPYEEMQDIHDRRQARQQETTPVEEQAQRSRQGEAVGFCPLQIPGTRVLISESEQSIVLTWLTGDEEKVEQLREMVHQMTASYASEVEAGAKESPPLGASGEAVVPGLVRSENIEGGVKQFYVPQATTQRDALQRQLTQRLQQMSQGFCPELIS